MVPGRQRIHNDDGLYPTNVEIGGRLKQQHCLRGHGEDHMISGGLDVRMVMDMRCGFVEIQSYETWSQKLFCMCMLNH